jgi:hypothetical protein
MNSFLISSSHTIEFNFIYIEHWTKWNKKKTTQRRLSVESCEKNEAILFIAAVWKNMQKTHFSLICRCRCLLLSREYQCINYVDADRWINSMNRWCFWHWNNALHYSYSLIKILTFFSYFFLFYHHHHHNHHQWNSLKVMQWNREKREWLSLIDYKSISFFMEIAHGNKN